MPIANEQYQDFSSFLALKEYPVYAFEFTSPELVWASGQKLPRLNAEDPLPGEAAYYLMVCPTCVMELSEHFAAYTAEKVSMINLNSPAEGTREYKQRKMATVYKMTLKP